MTHDEAKAIHERLDRIQAGQEKTNVQLADVAKAVTVYATQREACLELQNSLKRGLWGNGKESLDTRVARMESQRAGALKLLSMLIAAAAAGGTIAGVIVVLVK